MNDLQIHFMDDDNGTRSFDGLLRCRENLKINIFFNFKLSGQFLS